MGITVEKQKPDDVERIASQTPREKEAVTLYDGESTPFCQGMPMAMFMDGFHWSLGQHSDPEGNAHKRPPCLNYLFASFLLDEGRKFHYALVVTMMVAIATESLSVLRHYVMVSLPKASIARGMVLTLVYALQSLMGYIIMFVAMTYSMELFLAVGVGLAVGHALFRYLYPRQS